MTAPAVEVCVCFAHACPTGSGIYLLHHESSSSFSSFFRHLVIFHNREFSRSLASANGPLLVTSHVVFNLRQVLTIPSSVGKFPVASIMTSSYLKMAILKIGKSFTKVW
ncbi:hypothetical protein N657DRAFT_443652 [Parathielavia appendiculata]|uniref:Uncharacterized protein n=1 Tax=Parathielavia appendiculata TaxID=2587402 RepID=A0AAN6Z2K3_9PEZI|nr:hypothetical protein N657DRAFT_443652 [Parathielavia appendiculata]